MSTVMVSHPSFSSRQLARALGVRRVIAGSKRVPDATTVLNWGCADIPGIGARLGIRVLNRPTAVREAVNKLVTLTRLREAGVPTVDFTEDKRVARGWLRDGNTVYGRTLLRSSGGEGINLYIAGKHNGPIGDAPLYTRFWKCDREVRVHVIGDQVVDFAEKRKVGGFQNPSPERYWIRTHDRGWIYAREGARLHDNHRRWAIRAVRALGLDFGAVDMRVRHRGECAVLEINTAPGITGTTLESYTEGLRGLLRG